MNQEGRIQIGSALFASGSRLSRRPAKRTAAQQMHVKMVHGLPTVRSTVDHHAITIGQSRGACDLCRCPQKVTEQSAIILICIDHRHNVFSRRYQNMHWRLRMNVRESVAKVVLEDCSGRNASTILQKRQLIAGPVYRKESALPRE